MQGDNFFSHPTLAAAHAAQANLQPAPYSLGNFQLPPASNPLPPLNVPPVNLTPPMAGQQLGQFGLFSGSAAQPQAPGFFGDLNQQKLDPALSAPTLAKDTAVELLKPPAALSTGLLVLDAAKTGYELNKNIQKDLDRGVDPVEAHVCQTVKTVTENGLNALGTGAVIGGIPAYLAACVADPALALTIPVVGAAIPQAVHNVSVISQAAGNQAEQLCHDSFERARQLSRGGK